MTRQKIKVKKKPCGIFTALGLSETKKQLFESLLTNKFREFSQISDVIEDLWNDPGYSDKEIIVLLISIGRAQAQTEIKQEADKMLYNLKREVRTIK